MTGRFSIRSGTHSVPIGGGIEGMTQWEVTIAEKLSEAGYATAAYGKWHLGSENMAYKLKSLPGSMLGSISNIFSFNY